MSTRQVILDGGSPWGFRMHGGADVQQPLRISRVNPGSKAAQRGIREGDFISSINGQTTRGVSNAEAHALLRNAGNTLTLGLNQESTGSPKRRAQKLAQEAKEDILKRSSITSTSSSLVSNFSTTNISNTIPSNESFYSNGVSNHKRTSDESLSHAASNYSPYVKNSATSATSRGASDEEDDVHSRDSTVTDCNHINSTTRPLIITIRPVDSTSNESAVIASTTTATETVDDSVIDCEASSDKQAQILSAVIMADNVHASSRSRKQRRSRTNRKKSKKCTAVTQHNPIEPVGDTDNVVVRELSDCEPLESIVKETYRVESPITVPVEKKTNPMVKSRSLDDEDQVKIMEVTDELQVKSASESIAIVSEAESDVEWETVSDFADEKTLQQIGKLSVISLPLEEQRLFEPSNISPEDERSLRDFLKSLDLVNSAEESVKRIEKPSTSDSAKARKAKKRAALVQHFLPHYQNPRYLDVISEEGSDISDKDSKKNPFARPQFAEDDYDDEDDVFVDVQKKMREKFQSVYADSLEGAILVDTKLLEHDYPMVKEATWSTSIAETRSGAEVVYLEDSSSSMTPSDLLDQEDTVDADDEEDISIDLDKSFSDNFELNTTESASLANTDVSITLSKECAQVKAEPTPPSSVDISANGVEEHPEIDLPSNKTPIDFLQRLSLAYSENSTEENHIMSNDEKGFDMPRNSIDLSNKIDEKMKYLQELINNVNESTTDTLNEINLEEFNSSNLDIEKLINDSELNTESLPEITNGHTEDTSVRDIENKLNDKAENKFEPKELIIQIELQDGINNKFEESTKENVKQETIHECIQEFKTTTEERKLNAVDEISNTIKECSRRNNSKEIKTINEEESHKSKEHMIKIELLDEIDKIKETNIKQGKLMDEKPCRQQSNKKEHIIKVELEKEINNENKESKKIINENSSMHESSKTEHIIKVELLDGVSNKMKTNVTEAMDENRVMHKKEQIIKVELLHEDHTIKESNMGKERKLLRSNQNSTKEHIIKVELEDEIGNQMKENIKRNKIQEDSNQIKERIIKVELLDELCNDIKQFNLKSDTVKEKSTDVKLNRASTENDNELNKELKQLCESLLKTRSDEYSNTAEISRPESADSACSSSRSTSQCTAFYNPVHSSLTNIAAMLREGSFDDRVSPDVATLRELCIKTLLSMPFGKDIIEELATVSLSLEEMACQNPSLQSPNIPTKPNTKSPSPLIPVHNKTDDDDSLLVSSTINLPVAPPKMDAETWIGMPTEIDPNVLLCLSPSQKDFIETTKTVPKEADSLLDLHRKYIERRGYHEAYEMFKPTPQKEVRTVQIKIQPRSENKLLKIIQNDNSAQNIINYNNYLKTFTREIPLQVTKSTDAEMKKETNISNGNIRYDTYIKQLTREVPIQVERQIHKPVNNKIYEGAFESEDTKTDRLNARRLSEWLNLSRTGDCADKINNFKEDFNRNCNLQSSVNKLVSQRSCDEHHSHSTTSTVKRSTSPRRYSLPFNLYEQQMQYILEKEREIEREIEKLREEKAKLEKCEDNTVTTEESINNNIPSNKQFDAGKYQISRKGDIAILQDSPTEKFREKMYNEYMCKVAERQERKQNKVIKIKITTKSNEPSTSELSPQCDVKHTTGLEDEFIKKVRERMDKLGLNEESNSDEDKNKNGETSCDTEPVLVMDGGSVAAAKKLPKHLQEFVDFTRTTASSDAGVWTPGTSGEAPTPAPRPIKIEFKPPKERSPPKEPEKSDEPAPVVWTPRSAGSSPTAERKEFKPVTFESPVLSRKNKSKETTPVGTPEAGATLQQPPWEGGKVTTAESSHTLQESTVTSTLERRLTTSHSAPTAGLNNLSKLPRAQNPTITLLQRAREGQLPRGASYIEQQTQYQSIPKHRSKDERPPFIGPNEILYTVKNEYMSESDSEKPKKMANLGPRKFEGIGPTTKDGMPIVLRSEVKDGNQAKWYKQMYDTLHRAKNDDEYVTVRYKTRRGRYPYTSAGGYLSEPEPNAYDSDAAISASKYATLDRRRLQPNRDKENEYITYTVPRNKYMSASVKHSTDVYKNQPGRIENYIPGHSSISEKEAKEWWDEVMEIFDGHLEQQKHVPPQTKSYMSHALKESGYESDSTLVFRRREDAALQLSPHEQKEVYKNIQKGGDVPLHGLRKLAPERPKESPRKYVEDEVTIHYRSPVRHEIKEMISEEELARKQAEAMRRIYQEERRRKYLQELQDMNSRRHTDNFIPSQKSPIPLNRYDDFIDNVSMKMKPRDQSPEPRLVARAIYNFVGQSSRELTFRKGDVIFIRRQVDKNWYEGEHNAMIGLFPSNYVEIVPYDGIKSTPRKAHEGQARAKFNFIAQTHLELSLAKGELVVLTRRVDDNWYEGRIGSRKGIFPVSYIDVLIDPSDKQESIPSSKPVASPAAHSLLLNGSSGGKESMGSHHYQPSYSPQPTTTSYHAKPVNVIGTSSSYHSLTRTQKLTTPSVNEALHIDTHSEPVPYRALYKYKPQNDDELELLEGDTVYVLEKCDDGWYVGSSQRTGAFGTFPGNYVERI